MMTVPAMLYRREKLVKNKKKFVKFKQRTGHFKCQRV